MPKPTRFCACPPPPTARNCAPPMSSMRLPLLASCVPMSHATRLPSKICAFTPSSSPHPFTRPMLMTWLLRKPTEGAVVVTTKRRNEEEAVLPPRLLLDVHADRGVCLIGLQPIPRRTAGDGGDRRGGERRTSC